MGAEGPGPRRAELAVLALALLTRLGGWWSIGETPYADAPLVDAYTYWTQAQQLLAGRDPFADGFYQPPAYPVLLWGLFSLTGSTAPQLVRGLQAAAGVLSTWLLMRAGRGLGRHLQAPWLGALAGAIYALYPTTLLFELDLLTPSITALLIAGAFALLLPAGAPGLRRSLGAGLCLGAAASFHPSTLLAAPALAWGLRTRGRRPVAALLLGTALALSPTTGANLLRFGQPSLVSQNDGLNFYLGNNPDWRETSTLRPGLEFRQLVLEADPATRGTTFARNTYWRQRSLEAIAAAPWSWLEALTTKAAWSINDAEIPRNEDYRCRLQRPVMSWIGRLPLSYGLAFPLAGLGALTLWRLGGLARAVPLSWLALHLPLLIFLVSDRYRVATWPALALCAAAGAAALRRAPPSPRIAPALGALILLPWLPIDRRVGFDPGWCLHQDANFAYADRDWPRARDLYRAALSYDPEDLSARSWLGRSLLELGDARGALEVLEPLVAAFPDSHPSLVLISQAAARAGELDAAADYMGRAYRTPGPRTHTGARYVELLVRAGREAEARAVVAADPSLREHPKVSAALGGAP